MTDRQNLLEQVGGIGDARVLCVGDVMLDRFIYGEVERISPEAPIPVLRIGHERLMLGGAGNVANNIAALGGRVHFVSVIGNDDAGAAVRAELDRWDGHLESGLITVAARQTTIKNRFLSGTQQLMRADREDTGPLGEADRALVTDAVKAALDQASVVVLSDYGKGVLDAVTTAEIIKAARDAGKIVIVDPKGDDFSRYAGADLITPNRRELAEATRQAADGDTDIAAQAQALARTHNIGAVLVTRSADGMTLAPAKGEVSHIVAEAREVFDVSGAGDTVVAALAWALAGGMDLTDAAHIANIAGGIVVGKVGTAVVFEEDLVGALRHEDISSAEAKIVPWDLARDRAAQWRNDGLSVGFTNGCFDLLHPGHVSLMKQAKTACDRLIVGLNSDTSVARLKGADRPVQPETARAQVLASMANVDLVVIFSDDTPLDLIEALHPDVLVKGADYALDDVVGADLIQGYGGRVVLAELEPGHSTSATIARLNK